MEAWFEERAKGKKSMEIICEWSKEWATRCKGAIKSYFTKSQPKDIPDNWIELTLHYDSIQQRHVTREVQKRHIPSGMKRFLGGTKSNPKRVYLEWISLRTGKSEQVSTNFLGRLIFTNTKRQKSDEIYIDLRNFLETIVNSEKPEGSWITIPSYKPKDSEGNVDQSIIQARRKTASYNCNRPFEDRQIFIDEVGNGSAMWTNLLKEVSKQIDAVEKMITMTE